MKTSRLLLVCAALLAGFWAVAQKPQDQVFKDRAGQLRLWNMSSHEVAFSTKGPLVFRGTGSPLKGRSEAQGLDLESRSLEAELETATGGRYLLKSADLKGGVKLDQKRQGLTRVLTSQAALLEDSATEGTITLSTPFVFNQSQPAEGGALGLELRAAKGAFTTDPFRQSQSKLRKVDLNGSVVMNYTAARGKGELKTSQASLVGYPQAKVTLPAPFTLAGSGTTPEGGTRTLNASGSTGVASLDLAAADSRRQLVALEITGASEVLLVERKAGDEEVRTVKASAPKLTYSLTGKTLTLTGGVNYTVTVDAKGKEPLGGEGQSETLIITFNDQGEVVDYRAKSGTATIRQGSGGGRK